MSSISEEADPSESRAAARNAAAGPMPSRVTFNRFELDRILNLYGRMVADGEWRDYAIDFLRDRAVFSVFRRASEVPIYRIEKDPRLARKQGIYSVISASGLILRRGHELDRALHHHGVEPAAELEADIRMGPDHLKSAPSVHADRSGIGGIADHRNHLAIAARLRLGDQPLQQLQADPAAMDRRLKIDRILHREAIGRPRPVRARIGVTDHAAVECGNQIGKAAVHQHVIAPCHLVTIRRDQLEGRGTVTDPVLAKLAHERKVWRGSGPDFEPGHAAETIFARRKRKAPAIRPGL